MKMIRKTISDAVLYKGKMEAVMPAIEQTTHILTDPPYLYLKTHDFDKPFDEQLFFDEAKRLLPDHGFIALFGRGTSFYRWNTRLAELGFIFKEELVWDKQYTTNPCIALSRVHETISIHTKKRGKIRRAEVPYIEQKQFDLESIVNDIKRIKSALNTEAGLNAVQAFLQGGGLYNFDKTKNSIKKRNGGSGICISKDFPKIERRENTTLRMINGMREKSVIKLAGSHYGACHPTEKPVRLAERILALISEPGDTVYDPFMGSGSFGIACLRTGRRYIGSEMNQTYFDIACRRIQAAAAQPVLI